MRYLSVLALAFGSVELAAAIEPHSLDVVCAKDIVSLAVSHGGSWRPLAADFTDDGRTLRVDLPDAGSCLRDFRAQFADATALILRDVDVCRERALDPSFYRPRMHKRRAPSA